MAAICSDFKWSSFQIFDPIWNMDHLQTNLFLTIPNPKVSRFHIPTASWEFLFFIKQTIQVTSFLGMAHSFFDTVNLWNVLHRGLTVLLL